MQKRYSQLLAATAPDTGRAEQSEQRVPPFGRPLKTEPASVYFGMLEGKSADRCLVSKALTRSAKHSISPKAAFGTRLPTMSRSPDASLSPAAHPRIA